MTGALARYLEEALGRSRAMIEDGHGAAIAAHGVLATAQAVASDLSTHAIDAGEPVLVTISNHPMDLAAMLGVWLAGGVVVPVHANAGVLTAEAVQQATGARYRITHDCIDKISDICPPARDLLREAALIIFTSGSTGKPKGVVIGHERLAGKLAVLDRLVNLSEQDKVIVPLQLTFIFGIWVSLLSLRSGARLVLVAKFAPADLASTFAGGGSVLAAVPSMLRAMLSAGMPVAPKLRMVLTGGEPLGVVLGSDLRAALPRADIYDLYGLTETGSCDFCLPPGEIDAGVGSIGRPTEHVAFRLVGENKEPLPDGVSGELCIRTPFAMLGYLDDPALTANSFSEGYFRTGDLAKVRPDGQVEIVGRLKDIISRGGNKIAPAEIDALLCSHPDVAAALCAGVPDARLGEAIYAIVVPKPNAALTPEALRRWVADRIEKYKIPDAIYLRDTLPVGATGKVLRSDVAQLALTVAGCGRSGR